MGLSKTFRFKGGGGITENIMNDFTCNLITMKTSILCDFDGTITTKDVCVLVLSHFADGDWEAYDDNLLEGKIGLEECMRLQFQMVKADKGEILSHLEKKVSIRDGFKDFVDDCLRKKLSFTVISAGLDFVIRHFLNLQGLSDVEVISGKTSIRDNGIEFEFPRKRFDDSIDFKVDFVRHQQSIGFRARARIVQAFISAPSPAFFIEKKLIHGQSSASFFSRASSLACLGLQNLHS